MDTKEEYEEKKKRLDELLEEEELAKKKKCDQRKRFHVQSSLEFTQNLQSIQQETFCSRGVVGKRMDLFDLKPHRRV